MDSIEELSRTLVSSQWTGGPNWTGPADVLLFNLNNDPYELRNVCDDEKTLCDSMSAHVWQECA